MACPRAAAPARRSISLGGGGNESVNVDNRCRRRRKRRHYCWRGVGASNCAKRRNGKLRRRYNANCSEIAASALEEGICSSFRRLRARIEKAAATSRLAPCRSGGMYACRKSDSITRRLKALSARKSADWKLGRRHAGCMPTASALLS